MTERTAMITRADFADPEEGATATVDRMVLALAYHRVGYSALQTLILLTAQASGSEKVIAMAHPVADLEKLSAVGLIEWASKANLVRLT